VNDLLLTEDRKQYIDLLSGSGTVFLGHANPAIARAVKEQLDALWGAGALPTRVGGEARAAVEQFLPPSHGLAVFYSTGMEAVEFALRVARRVTGRKGVVGFNGCMHGKSMAAARLGWPNPLATLPDFHSLPYLPERSEGEILESVRSVLATESIAAVFLEPLLGSRGGYIPSRHFAEQLSSLCAEHGSLLVMDEIFTGFYRTGSLFLHQELGVTPDILLIGKAMGNGFPVSAVVVDRRYPIEGSMLPGSTFAGNPLAASAVVATLREMRANDMPAKVRKIEQTILAGLNDLTGLGIALRGKGALWILELPTSMRAPDVMARILRDGVIVSPTANYIRLLPAATITVEHLTQACGVIRAACQAQSGSGR
jgi:acetylornithine/succinyldiaminopimelate/putrescine aminotransferase